MVRRLVDYFRSLVKPAIVDPPWYPSDTIAFLAATSRVCKLGACILLCQPTHATRPGVSEERAALLAELPRLGLAYVDTRPTVLRYMTPHFEEMSLRTTLQDIDAPLDWRKGDLLVLTKMSEAREQELPTLVEDDWSEVHFGPVRIKLRRRGDIDLANLVAGDVLDTVSRRDPVRDRIGFWTSGNRVYTLARPKLIGRLIELCNTDYMNGAFTFSSCTDHARALGLVEHVYRRLFDTLLIELTEHCERENCAGDWLQHH